jgi:CDP-paratose 2-epimerase
VFICDIRKAADRLGWAPQIHVNDGVRHLIRWVRDNRDLFGWLKP